MRDRMFRWGLPFLLLAALGVTAGAMAATATTHAGTVRTVKNGKFGTILVAANGRTLYRYTLDRKGVNRCSSNATCNKYWPPLVVKTGAKPTAGSGVKAAMLGTIKAAHGMRQVTYAGFPLYYFFGDKSAGQTKGQGFESQWYVVNTKGGFVRQAVTTKAPPTTTTSPAPTTTSGGESWG
jgi:predicted lipoprotein with Yx(FWY)xxD motif